MVKKSIGIRVMILPLSLALVVMIAVIYIKPLFSQILEYRKSVEEGQKQLADLNVQFQKLSQLKSSWQSMEEKKIIEAALPQDESTESFLAEMYQRAARSGVIMSDFSSASSILGGSLCPAAGVPFAGGEGATATSSEGASAAASPIDNPSQSSSAATASLALCVKNLPAQIALKGSWDQLLNFLKYSADSNRIANLKSIAINPSAATSGNPEASGEQAPSDVLSAAVTVEAYYQSKSGVGNSAVLSALTKQTGFSKDVIGKIQEIVYSPYEPPLVSETGERNIFK